ncbi:MAG TPA: C40 family peptidase [Solimonas sp.]|nr:C40 family peptidase [Solimonas sp.]
MSRLRALVVLAALWLAACGSNPPSPELVALRHNVVLEALGQVGRPYRAGGASPDGFDCSGLVQYVFAQAGIRLPRSAREQHAKGNAIDVDDAEPGDLLFYRIGGKVDHVGIYLGDGEALHAPGTGRAVIVAPIGLPYWKERFVDAVRVLE